MPEDSATSAVAQRLWLPAAVVTGLHSLGLLVVAVEGLLQAAGTTNLARAISFALTVAALAVCAGLLARALLLRRSFARTPTLVWHGFALLAGFTLTTSGAPVIGVVVLVTALAGVIAALRLPRPEL